VRDLLRTLYCVSTAASYDIILGAFAPDASEPNLLPQFWLLSSRISTEKAWPMSGTHGQLYRPEDACASERRL
jgi:hypothetical protein